MNRKLLYKYPLDNYINKMNSRQLCFIVIMLVFGCISCKKYPDDHKISLQTAKKRLRAHEWHFSKLYINDADSTMTHLHNIIPNSNRPADFSFKITEGMNCLHDEGKMAIPFYPKPSSNYPDYTSSISIDRKKTILKIGGGLINNNPNTILVPSTMNSIFWVIDVVEASWEITKLTKTDLHLKSTYNNYEVKFEFVK